MKKIIISSFMGSGSSAITDLLSEYKDVNCDNGAFEYVFLHCPNGLFDLEDKILYGNTMIKSDDSLRQFELAMKELYLNKRWWFANYQSRVSADFMDYTMEFIHNITDLEYDGYWYEHEKVNKTTSYLNLAKHLFNHFMKTKFKSKKLYNGKIKVSFVSKEEFYFEARKYLDNFFNSISKSGDTHVVVDQLLSPYNLYRLDRYFDDDTKVIVVRRDPRDVFLLNKYVWSIKNNGIPFPLEVEKFCLFYEKMMKSIINYSDNPNILKINFEDLIFEYEKTVSQLEVFCELSPQKHIYDKNFFNPNISQNNTNIIFDDEKSNLERLFIKKQLSEYIYNFKENKNTEKKALF